MPGLLASSLFAAITCAALSNAIDARGEAARAEVVATLERIADSYYAQARLL